MWRGIIDFSDYLISDDAMIFRVSTGELTQHDGKVVSIKSDDGLWKNRSVSKLVAEAFDHPTQLVIATSITNVDIKQTFVSIAEAAKWLIDTKQAITSGRIAAYQTVRTNIKNGIEQPELYPYVYGYEWKTTEGDS